MKQQVWIWSASWQWWTNGIIKIDGLTAKQYPWDVIREITYNSFNTKLCKDPLQTCNHWVLKQRLLPYWIGRPVEEIIDIIDGSR